MLTDYDLASLTNTLYRPPWPKGYWKHLWTEESCYAAHKVVDGADIVIFRGSSDILDWWEDFSALPVNDPALGMVHQGFWKPLQALCPQIDAVLTQPKTIILGHSLGAARACLYGAHRTVLGKPPSEIVIWGCPKPGFQKLADILAPVTLRSYKNLNDPVTTVPDYLPNLDQLYMPVREFIPVSAQPSPFDMWNILQAHHLSLYCSALAKICGNV